MTYRIVSTLIFYYFLVKSSTCTVAQVNLTLRRRQSCLTGLICAAPNEDMPQLPTEGTSNRFPYGQLPRILNWVVVELPSADVVSHAPNGEDSGDESRRCHKHMVGDWLAIE